jgi:hypothetical protein
MPRLWSSEMVLMASGLGSLVRPNTASKLESRDKQKTARPFGRKNCTSGQASVDCHCGLPALTVDPC